MSVEEHRKLNHARRTSAYKIKFMEEKTCEKLCAKTLTKQEKAWILELQNKQNNKQTVKSQTLSVTFAFCRTSSAT